VFLLELSKGATKQGKGAGIEEFPEHWIFLLLLETPHEGTLKRKMQPRPTVWTRGRDNQVCDAMPRCGNTASTKMENRDEGSSTVVCYDSNCIRTTMCNAAMTRGMS